MKKIFFFIIILFFVLIFSGLYPYFNGKVVNSNYKSEFVYITKVIDGDTFKGDDGNSYRLLGINTPEKNMPQNKNAYLYLLNYENRTVELIRDKEDKDRYKRKLRYILIDDKIINAEILQQGLATSFMLDGLKYSQKLKDAETFSYNSGLGLWNKSNDVCSSCIVLLKLDYKNEFFSLKNICNIECNLKGWFVKDDANHVVQLSNLAPYDEKTYYSKVETWNNDKDRFYLRDKNGNLVIFYEYSRVG